MRGHRLRRHVGPVPAPQGALRRVLRLQLLDQLLDGVGVPLTGVLGDDVALGVDDDERGPGAYGVLLPGGQLGVVEHRVVHLVPLHRVDDRLVLRLVDELRRVHADDHDGVAVLLLQLAQLVENMQAVHAAEGPEIHNNALTSQVGEGELFAPSVQPATLADQLGGTDTGMAAGLGRGGGRRGSIVHPSSLPSWYERRITRVRQDLRQGSEGWLRTRARRLPARRRGRVRGSWRCRGRWRAVGRCSPDAWRRSSGSSGSMSFTNRSPAIHELG